MEKNKQPIEDKILQEISALDKRVVLIMIIGAIALISLPIFATQLDWFCDFTKTGSIGDTVGGLTAPVIGVISALLIYFSFRAQINANRIIQNQINDQKKDEIEKKEFNYQMEIYKHIKESIEQFTYTVGNDEINGRDAISKFFDDYTNIKKRLVITSSYKRFHGIIDLFKILVQKIENSKEQKIDFDLVLTLVDYQYSQFFWLTNALKVKERLESRSISDPYIKICNELIDLKDRLTWLQNV